MYRLTLKYSRLRCLGDLPYSDLLFLQEPAAEPNPEQTTSLLSLALYFFLDPIIFKAYRVPHLSADEFPPLADYDYSKNLVKRSFKVRAGHVLLCSLTDIFTAPRQIPRSWEGSPVLWIDESVLCVTIL